MLLKNEKISDDTLKMADVPLYMALFLRTQITINNLTELNTDATMRWGAGELKCPGMYALPSSCTL